jgi:hypothetical protein
MDTTTISFTIDGRAETLRKLAERLITEATVGVERADEPGTPQTIAEYLANPKKEADYAEFGLLGQVLVYEPDPSVTRARVRVAVLAHAMSALKTTRESHHGRQFRLWMDLMRKMKRARQELGRTVESAREALFEKVALDPNPRPGPSTWLPPTIEQWEIMVIALGGLQGDLGRELMRFSPDEYNVARSKGGRKSKYLLGKVVDWLRTPGFDGSPAFTFPDVLALVTDNTADTAEEGRLERYKRAVQAYRRLKKMFQPVANAQNP